MRKAAQFLARPSFARFTAPLAMSYNTSIRFCSTANTTSNATKENTNSSKKNSSNSVDNTSGGIPAVGNQTTIVTGPYRRVGNIFIVLCNDHPFKFSWEINRALRDLRLEYKGQTTIVPDIPAVRKQLWRVRHIVRVDMLDLDEAKALVGIPEHINFQDLNRQLPATFGRVRATASPHLRSKMNFMRLRRMRLRDVLHRDALEKRLLEEKRKVRDSAPKEAEAK